MKPAARKSLSTAVLALSALFALRAAPAPDPRIARVENGLLPPVLVKGQKPWNILDRMKHYNVPGVSVAVFCDDKVQWAKGYGVMDNETKAPVTEKTLFVAGSISKPVAVMGALRLVQEGKLALDTNINAYLTSWKLPENALTAKSPVTLRRIMSHSAGLTVHGFRGYAPGELVPTLIDILNGVPPANSSPILVDIEPGTQWRYSGGGLTVMQLALMDIEKKPFPEVLREKVLEPLGMTSSSYEQAMPPDRLKLAASGHDAGGKVVEGKRFIYPEMAAAGLWTTPTDLAKFAIEVGRAARGQSDKVLSKDMAKLMVTPQIVIGGTTGDGPRALPRAPRLRGLLRPRRPGHRLHRLARFRPRRGIRRRRHDELRGPGRGPHQRDHHERREGIRLAGLRARGLRRRLARRQGARAVRREIRHRFRYNPSRDARGRPPQGQENRGALIRAPARLRERVHRHRSPGDVHLRRREGRAPPP